MAYRPLTTLAGALALALCFGAAQAKEWKQVTIATEGAFPPYNMHGPDGKLIGYEIDLAAELCKRVNLTCTFVPQDWDGIIPGLQAGKFDAIMSGMSITPKREEVIAFSLPYANSPTTLATMKGDALAELPGTGQRVSLDDKAATQAAVDALKPKLKGKTIAVQVATIQADFLNTYLKDCGVDIRSYKTNEQQDLDVHDGRADAELGSLELPAHRDGEGRPRPDRPAVHRRPARQGLGDRPAQERRGPEGAVRQGPARGQGGRLDEGAGGEVVQGGHHADDLLNGARALLSALAIVGPEGWGPLLLRAAGMTLAVSVSAFIVGLCLGALGAAARLSRSRLRARRGRNLHHRRPRRARPAHHLPVLLRRQPGDDLARARVRGQQASSACPRSSSARSPSASSPARIRPSCCAAHIGAIPRGELEAARAVGMGRLLMLRRITAPLVLRTALPGMGNIWQQVIKESALISVTGLVELMRQVTVGAGSTHQPFVFYIAGTVLYLVLTTLSGFVLPRRGVLDGAGNAPRVTDTPFLLDTFLRLLGGLPLTLELAASSVAIGAVLAILLTAPARLLPTRRLVRARLRLRHARLAAAGADFPDLLRARPVLLPCAKASSGRCCAQPIWCAILSLSLNTAAYGSEILRGGLRSVRPARSRPRVSAACRAALMYRRIILPIAIRQALPAYGSEVIIMVKSTSLASIITLMEVTGIAQEIISTTVSLVRGLHLRRGDLLAINFVLARVVLGLERWLSPRRHARGMSGTNVAVRDLHKRFGPSRC